jgi:hypothetical protein
MTREAYSHEVISCGFWPGDDRFRAPAFYSYTSPQPPGLPAAAIRPEEAFYHHELGLFLLRYDDVRSASSPEQALLEFFQSTYEAGARLAQWDREALERSFIVPFHLRVRKSTIGGNFNSVASQQCDRDCM